MQMALFESSSSSSSEREACTEEEIACERVLAIVVPSYLSNQVSIYTAGSFISWITYLLERLEADEPGGGVCVLGQQVEILVLLGLRGERRGVEQEEHENLPPVDELPRCHRVAAVSAEEGDLASGGRSVCHRNGLELEQQLLDAIERNVAPHVWQHTCLDVDDEQADECLSVDQVVVTFVLL